MSQKPCDRATVSRRIAIGLAFHGAVVLTAHALSAPDADSRVQVIGQRVLDRGGPVAFEVPFGWKLKVGYTSGDSRIVHEASEA